MKKYEYEIYPTLRDNMDDEVNTIAVLNKLGLEGWELIFYVPTFNEQKIYYHFKREIIY
jgi:hypothetical protein